VTPEIRVHKERLVVRVLKVTKELKALQVERKVRKELQGMEENKVHKELRVQQVRLGVKVLKVLRVLKVLLVEPKVRRVSQDFRDLRVHKDLIKVLVTKELKAQHRQVQQVRRDLKVRKDPLVLQGSTELKVHKDHKVPKDFRGLVDQLVHKEHKGLKVLQVHHQIEDSNQILNLFSIHFRKQKNLKALDSFGMTNMRKYSRMIR
jgi:hypothetical protein